MKKALFSLGLFLVFFLVFAAGSFLHPWNMHWAQKTAPTGVTSYFVADGLLLTIGLFLGIVLAQVLRKRSANIVWTTISFVVALAAGYAVRLGFKTIDF